MYTLSVDRVCGVDGGGDGGGSGTTLWLLWLWGMSVTLTNMVQHRLEEYGPR